MNMTLTFCTNFNGIYLNPDDDGDQDALTWDMEMALDRVADTLPSKTYEWCGKWDYELTEAQIAELIDDAKELIKDEFPDVCIKFEYDTRST